MSVNKKYLLSCETINDIPSITHVTPITMNRRKYSVKLKLKMKKKKEEKKREERRTNRHTRIHTNSKHKK